MKKVLLGLLVLAALGLIFAACHNPADGIAGGIPRNTVALNDVDKAAAAPIIPVVSSRTNASGKDISSNGQGAAVPGMYFFWDPKQKDNAYLKVEAQIFFNNESFILTTKEANKYWDFVIQPQAGQEKTADGYYVFYIPKQEKNINGVWVSDYVDRLAGLYSIVEDYYGDMEDFTPVSRYRKMQALMMEMAIKAKSRNSNFSIIPQDTMQLGFIDGNNNASTRVIDWNVVSLLDGWGVESTGSNAILNELYRLGGIKPTTCTTPGAALDSAYNTFKTAEALGIIYYPRLPRSYYNGYGTTPGPAKGDPMYRPYFAANYHRIVDELPERFGIGYTVNTDDINKPMDAKNYLYQINSLRYDDWEIWDSDFQTGIGFPRQRVNNQSYVGFMVPSPTGPYHRDLLRFSNASTIPSDLTGPDYDYWDWWWRVEGFNENEGAQKFVEAHASTNWDMIYIDPHYAKFRSLTREEVAAMQHKANGGRRQVIGYISIGTAEWWRWFADESMVEANTVAAFGNDLYQFLCGQVSGSTFTPAHIRYAGVPGKNPPKWSLFPAYSGSFADESQPIFWCPEWRDIMVRGGFTPTTWKFQNSDFPEGRSSIDRLVDMGFDGVYYDNPSRVTANASWWTAVGNYTAANPGWFLE